MADAVYINTSDVIHERSSTSFENESSECLSSGTTSSTDVERDMMDFVVMRYASQPATKGFTNNQCSRMVKQTECEIYNTFNLQAQYSLICDIISCSY